MLFKMVFAQVSQPCAETTLGSKLAKRMHGQKQCSLHWWVWEMELDWNFLSISVIKIREVLYSPSLDKKNVYSSALSNN